MRHWFMFFICLSAASLEAEPLPRNPLTMKRVWIAQAKVGYISDAEFSKAVQDGVLVKIVDNKLHVIDSRLDYDAQYIRPYALGELAKFERVFVAEFHHPIRINSAFRTIEHHADLRGRDANAAQGNSPHSTGFTLDISRLAMSPVEQKFTESWFKARHGKTLVFTIEHFPQTMYDVFFRPPQPP